jgi:hypothetical protein
MSFREIAENKFFQNLKIEDDSGVGQTRIGQSGMARKKLFACGKFHFLRSELICSSFYNDALGKKIKS